MKVPIYQVDAFTSKVFAGNPAAVCPLEKWLDDGQMQSIAFENNLSETAFFVPEGKQFGLRWFTPVVEVKMCGHATLATAHIMFTEMGYEKEKIEFLTKSGLLIVERKGKDLIMNFPSVEMPEAKAHPKLFEALGVAPAHKVYKTDDYMVVFDSEEEIREMNPDFRMLTEVEARGIIVTAPGKEVDFVSRFFGPQSGIDEDPVTGSAHTKLIPYWSKKLGKTELTARQVSKRGGDLVCKLLGGRVEIIGKAATYLRGEIII